MCRTIPGMSSPDFFGGLVRLLESVAILEHSIQPATDAHSAHVCRVGLCQVGDRARALGAPPSAAGYRRSATSPRCAKAHARTALGDLERGFKLYEEAYERHSGQLIFTHVPAGLGSDAGGSEVPSAAEKAQAGLLSILFRHGSRRAANRRKRRAGESDVALPIAPPGLEPGLS